jgi:hypothetical protein
MEPSRDVQRKAMQKLRLLTALLMMTTKEVQKLKSRSIAALYSLCSYLDPSGTKDTGLSLKLVCVVELKAKANEDFQIVARCIEGTGPKFPVIDFEVPAIPRFQSRHQVHGGQYFPIRMGLEIVLSLESDFSAKVMDQR